MAIVMTIDPLDETSSQPRPAGIPPTTIVLDSLTLASSVYEISAEVEPQEVVATEFVDLDVPRFGFFREIPPTKGIHTKGIQFTDKDPDGRSGP